MILPVSVQSNAFSAQRPDARTTASTRISTPQPILKTSETNQSVTGLAGRVETRVPPARSENSQSSQETVRNRLETLINRQVQSGELSEGQAAKLQNFFSQITSSSTSEDAAFDRSLESDSAGSGQVSTNISGNFAPSSPQQGASALVDAASAEPVVSQGSIASAQEKPGQISLAQTTAGQVNGGQIGDVRNQLNSFLDNLRNSSRTGTVYNANAATSATTTGDTAGIVLDLRA